MAAAVRRVYAGGRVVDPKLAMISVQSAVNPLTEREREVLALASSGQPVSAIATQFHLSVGTVRNHLSSAIGKTSAANRIEAARVAQDNGWI